MATHSVSFTSSTEGITFGVHSDSFVEALSLLVEEFGEGVIPLYEHTRAEFVELCRAVEGVERAPQVRDEPDEADAREPRGVQEDPDLAIFTQPDRDQDGGVRDDAEAEAVSDVADDVTTPDPTPSAAASAAAPEAVDEVPAHICVVCGAGVSADRAKATTLMQGEVRCTDCSTL